MLAPRIANIVPMVLKRNIGMTAALQNPAMDPIQELFLTKIREYKQKGGAKIEEIPSLVKERKDDLERISRQYNIATGTDVSKFPDFQFSEPKMDAEPAKK